MFFALTQYLVAAVTWLSLKLFARLEIQGIENLKMVRRPFVVAANHESQLDPQLVGVALLYQPRLFPLRYMAKNELFRIPGFNLLIWLLGAFKANKKLGIGKAIVTPIKILEQGGGVIMFPEGRIVPERPKLGEGRRGTAIMALTTRAAILPIALHTPAHLTFNPWQVFSTRPKIVVTIGAPFYLPPLDYPDLSDAHTYAATRVIMQKISDLYYRHKY